MAKICFAECVCDDPNKHGCFFNEENKEQSGPIHSEKEALAALRHLVRAGKVGKYSGEESELLEQIGKLNLRKEPIPWPEEEIKKAAEKIMGIPERKRAAFVSAHTAAGIHSAEDGERILEMARVLAGGGKHPPSS